MPNPNSEASNSRQGAHDHRYLWAQVLIVVFILAVGLWVSPVYAWTLTLLLMAAFVLVAGRAVTGFWFGALIDNRNCISLSRLQMILWTVLVLSAYLCASLYNVGLEQGDPLAIAIPAQVWILLGISTTSLVGSPLIKGEKRRKAAETKQTNATTAEYEKLHGVKPTADGVMMRKPDPSHACWGDVFQGEETGNGARLDLSKIQMFFFTVILVMAYGAAVAEMFYGAGGAPISAFPGLDESATILLGISHAGYLAHKAVPHSREKAAA